MQRALRTRNTTASAEATNRTHHPAALDEESAESAAQPCLLEADQGDAISGRVARAEAASVVVAALSAPDAAAKTFELRRCAGVSGWRGADWGGLRGSGCRGG